MAARADPQEAPIRAECGPIARANAAGWTEDSVPAASSPAARPATDKNPPAPSLANKIAAFDAPRLPRSATRCVDATACRAAYRPAPRAFSTRPAGDDQVLVARGCRLDESEIDDCLATANADCGVPDDFGEWKLDVERRCANVVPCTKP